MNPNWVEVGEMMSITALVVFSIVNQWQIRQLKDFEDEWIRYRKARQNLLEKMSDPTQIDFAERPDATAAQSKAIGRTTAPRPDAGPPAIVHRPKAMRAKLPSRWNPPADYNDRLRQR